MTDKAKEQQIHVAASPTRCPYCHDECLQSDENVVCNDCLARHHTSCWEGACASCGSDRGLGSLAPLTLQQRGAEALRKAGFDEAEIRSLLRPKDESTRLSAVGTTGLVAFVLSSASLAVILGGTLATPPGAQSGALLAITLLFPLFVGFLTGLATRSLKWTVGAPLLVVFALSATAGLASGSGLGTIFGILGSLALLGGPAVLVGLAARWIRSRASKAMQPEANEAP